MHNRGLDWKQLLQQKPAVKAAKQQSGFSVKAAAAQGSQQSSSTPQHCSGHNSEQQQCSTQQAVPFLLLPVAMPDVTRDKLPTQTGKSAADLLAKLAVLRKKAADLVDAAASAGPKQPVLTDILRSPLPPPEHVSPDQSAWFAASSYNSSEAIEQQASRLSTLQGISEPPFWDSKRTGSSSRAEAGVASTSYGARDSMATSATYQTARILLNATATSPSRKWQHTLERIKQLQQQTENALQQRQEGSHSCVTPG